MQEIDTERFRLRRFVEELVAQHECDVHQNNVDLVDVAEILDTSPRATWFRSAGPEGAEIVGNVMAKRRRLALALGTDEAGFAGVLRQRLENPIPPVRVESSDAPVQQVVVIGQQADLCALPVHLQHGEDGAPYISAGLDFAIAPDTGWTNIGCRRMMLRGPQAAGIDLNAPSDLRALYQDYVRRGEPLPIAYAVGSHPADFIAGSAAAAPMDEFNVVGAVRGAPLPIVKCVTSDVLVPADAEYVIEGYLDPAGLTEPEGPYGEYIGYYGTVKKNPVFHVTAITHRYDALFQTVTIGGRNLSNTETAQLTAAKTDATIWAALRQAVREPVAVYTTTSSGGMYNVRVSLRQRVPGEARNAIAAVFGSTADIKHVFVVDADIDVYSSEAIDWALATRFQADRDLVVGSGFRAVPLDPSLEGSRVGAKIGFDCTLPFGKADTFEYRTPLPPKLARSVGNGGPLPSVREVLAAGPATFIQIMERIGTRDGREIVRELDALYSGNEVSRNETGAYALHSRKH